MCISFCLFDKMSNKGNGSYFLLSVFHQKFIQKCLPCFIPSQRLIMKCPLSRKQYRKKLSINFPAAVLFNSIKKFPTHTQQKPNCTLAKKKVNPIPKQQQQFCRALDSRDAILSQFALATMKGSVIFDSSPMCLMGVTQQVLGDSPPSSSSFAALQYYSTVLNNSGYRLEFFYEQNFW